jgi:hypothetical protein
MFYTNEQVVEKLNDLHRTINHHRNIHDRLALPKMEELITILSERKAILFFYLTEEIGIPEIVAGHEQPVPTINMTLKQFFMHPWGDKLWSDDESLKFLKEENYNFIKDSINLAIEDRMNNYNVADLTEFVLKLNKVAK